MSEPRKVRAEVVDPQPAARRPTSFAVLVLGLIAAVLAAVVALLLIRFEIADDERQELACQVQRLGGKPVGDVRCPPTPAPAPPVSPAGPTAPALPPETAPSRSPTATAERPATGSTAPPRVTPEPPSPPDPAPDPEPQPPAAPQPPEPSPDVQVCTRLTGCVELDTPLSLRL